MKIQPSVTKVSLCFVFFFQSHCLECPRRLLLPSRELKTCQDQEGGTGRVAEGTFDPHCSPREGLWTHSQLGAKNHSEIQAGARPLCSSSACPLFSLCRCQRSSTQSPGLFVFPQKGNAKQAAQRKTLGTAAGRPRGEELKTNAAVIRTR